MYSFNGVIVVPRKHSKYKIAILAQILCGFFSLEMNHPYIMSAKDSTGWVGVKKSSLADVQYCIYADIVGGLGGSEKVQSYADVIYRWSLSTAASPGR